MAGFNITRMNQMNRSRFEYKTAYSKFDNGFDFPFIQPRDLPDGVYKIRVLPPLVGYCTDGFRDICFHDFPMRDGEPQKERPQHFCLRADGPDSDCRTCDLVEALSDVHASLPEHLQKVLSILNPQMIFMLPCVIDAMPDPAFRKPTPEQKTAAYTGGFLNDLKWRPDYVRPGDGKRRGCVFQITTKNLDEKMKALIQENPNINSPYAGRELTFSRKANVYDLAPAQFDSALPSEEMTWMDPKRYPKIDSFYKRVQRWSEAEIIQHLPETFWWRELNDAVGGINLDPEPEYSDLIPY